VATKPLSSDDFGTLANRQRIPLVATGDEADAATPVRFDRPLIEQPGWADKRVARHIAQIAKTAREHGVAQGYADGYVKGRRDAMIQARKESAERAAREETQRKALATRAQGMLAALAQASRTLTDQVTPAWESVVDVLVEGAVDVVAAVFGREVAALDAPVLESVRAALRLLPPAEGLAVHVNPEDVALFGADGDAGLPDGVRLEADAGVAPGTAVARTPLQALPIDLQAALRAAVEVLRS